MKSLFPVRRTAQLSKNTVRRRRLLLETLEKRQLLAVFNVDTFEDVVSNSDSLLSLREAITAANSNGASEVDEIVLPAGTFTLTRTGSPENNNALGDLDVNTPVIIRGAGQGSTIIDAGGDAGIGERVFQLLGNHAIAIQDLTIQGGRASGSSFNSGGGGIFAFGGTGSLVTLERVTLRDNQATQQGGGIAIAPGATVNVVLSSIEANSTAVDGGGIVNTGTLLVDRSTIINNESFGLGGGIFTLNANSRVISSTLSGNTTDTDGAGIANYNSTTSIVNSTVSGNTATRQAGGILNISSGAGNVSSLTLLQSTVTGNGQGAAAAVFTLSQNSATSAPLTVGNSIIAGNVGVNRNITLFNFNGGSGASIVSLGNNLSDNGNGLLTQPSDFPGVATPVIDPTLADNGGPTLTHALVNSATNPAIDGGASNLAVDPGADGVIGGGDDTTLLFDGRGIFVRSIGGGVDIGAVELVTFDTTDFVVNSLADSLLIGDGEVTLRDAIFAANQQTGADAITFADTLNGTITLGATELLITDSVTITGPGAGLLTIDGDGKSRIFHIDDGDNAAESMVTIAALTMTGGVAGDANALGDARNGGAIFSLEDLTVADSVITGNRAFFEGGGINSGSFYTPTTGTRLTVTNSTISSNLADLGDNFNGRGGGIAIRRTATISNSTLSGNMARSEGGGISNSGTATLTNSTISDNSATVRGGGLQNNVGRRATITSSTISGNSASSGGGLYNDGTATVTSSTISGNSASSAGGGLYNFGTTTLNNTIIAGSLAGGDLNGSFSGTHNLVQDGSGSGLTDTLTGDPMLGPLADNGGPTRTHALLAGSPAIDAGSNANATHDGMSGGVALTNDQRGAPFARRFNTSVDIGAFEFMPATTYVVSTTDDVVDNDLSSGNLSLREAILLSNGNVGADTITFADGLTGTITLTSQLVVIESITIIGPGFDQLILSGDNNSRIFQFGGGGANVYVLQGLTLENGESGAQGGAAIVMNDDEDTLNISRSTIRNSHGDGAIFVVFGQLLLRDSSINGNSGAFGGGLTLQDGTFVLTNVTISGNSATIRGGGIRHSATGNGSTSTLTIRNSTFANNSSPLGASLINSTQGDATSSVVQFENSIFAQPVGSANFVNFAETNSTAELISLGYNLADDDTGNLTATGDLPNTNPLLGPLQDNSGPTLTHSLLPGSPAIDAGTVPLVLDDFSSNDFATNYNFVSIFSSADNSPQVSAGQANLNVDSGTGAFIRNDQSLSQLGDSVSVDFGFNYPISEGAFDETFGETSAGLALFNSVSDGLLSELRVETDKLNGNEIHDFVVGSSARIALSGTPIGLMNLTVAVSDVTSGMITLKYTLTGSGFNTITSSETFNATNIFFGPSAFDARGTDTVHDNLTLTRFQFPSPDNDQRGPGFARVSGGRIDIGAIELQSLATELDFGDAPTQYPVSLAQDGARHTVGSLFLGAAVDAESDGTNSANAAADGSDEDGVFVIASFISASVDTISSFSVISSGPGKLDAWIDFNGNRSWLDDGEQIFTSVELVTGENLISFTIPANSTAGNTGARFRLSTAGDLAPTGAADDGEVEDYLAAIVTGSNTTNLVIDIPAGDSTIAVEGDNLVVRRGTDVLFQAPFASFGDVDLNGTSLDDIFQVTILEALASRVLSFDGGLGKDLLELIEAGQTLDLTNANITLTDIEVIDISGTGNNRLVVSIEAVKAASSTTDTLEVIANSGDTVDFGNRVARERWQLHVPMFIDDQFTHIITESASGGTARVEIHNDRLFQNPLNRFDVDRDGTVSARDALRLINELRRRINRNQPPQLEIPNNDGEISRFYFDVNGRNDLTALDALFVINAIVRIRRNPDAEGETAATLIDLNQFTHQPNAIRERPGDSLRFLSQQNDFGIDDLESPQTTPALFETKTDSTLIPAIDEAMAEYGLDNSAEDSSDLNWLSVLSGS